MEGIPIVWGVIYPLKYLANGVTLSLIWECIPRESVSKLQSTEEPEILHTLEQPLGVYPHGIGRRVVSVKDGSKSRRGTMIHSPVSHLESGR